MPLIIIDKNTIIRMFCKLSYTIWIFIHSGIITKLSCSIRFCPKGYSYRLTYNIWHISLNPLPITINFSYYISIKSFRYRFTSISIPTKVHIIRLPVHNELLCFSK